MAPGRSARAAAFAEGRRLREEAEMRRRMRRYHHRWHHTHPHPRPPWLLLIALVIIAGGVSAATIGTIALILIGVAFLASSVPMLFAVAAVYTTIRRSRRRAALRRGGSAGTAPLPGRPAAPPRPEIMWKRARDRFHALRSEYAAFECNPMEVLRLPALADVSVPSTARFVDAFAEAQALETDAFPPVGHASAFVSAVDRAERAWRAAREAAERIRLSKLSPAERATVDRVIKLLTTARDSDNDPERLAAYARARSELAKLDHAGVIQLPRAAQAALDTAARGALPA
jgi:hypothetical protein